MRHIAILIFLLLAAGLNTRADAQAATGSGTRSISADTDVNLIARNLPRVVYRGGPFIRHPRIVTVTFTGDDTKLVTRLEQFGDQITRTRWWREVTADYCANGECIGDGRQGNNVRLEKNLPARVSDIGMEELLVREAKAGAFDALDAEALLLIYLPPEIQLADAFNARYCGDGPRAFHRALKLNKVQVAYAVLPRCGGEADLTATASHEIIEATTNPDPSDRGFAFVQSSANLGFTAAGIEPVDPCGLINQNNRTIESGFVVQRAWSNRASARGENPCVPSIDSKNFMILVPGNPTVRLSQVGATATVALKAASHQGPREWIVSAVELGKTENTEPCLRVSLDASQVRAGQTVNLSATLLNPGAHNLCVIGIVSTFGANSYIWPLAVITH